MPEITQYITKSHKSKQLQKLINEALYILSKLGVPISVISYQLSVISYQLSVISY